MQFARTLLFGIYRRTIINGAIHGDGNVKKSIQDIAAYYFERFGFRDARIEPPLNPRTKMIVVIPVHNEPNVTGTLDSLQACQPPDSPVEIILVVNNSEHAESATLEQNEKSIEEIETWRAAQSNELIIFHFIMDIELPSKHAGV